MGDIGYHIMQVSHVDFYDALYAHHPKLNYHLSTYIWLPYLLLNALHTSPSGNLHTIAWVCEFLSHISHMSKNISFLAFSVWKMIFWKGSPQLLYLGWIEERNQGRSTDSSFQIRGKFGQEVMVTGTSLLR